MMLVHAMRVCHLCVCVCVCVCVWVLDVVSKYY